MTTAYWCILIAAIIPWCAASYAKFSSGFKPEHNQQPRDFLQQLTGKAARANAAQQNSYEILPLFAAAVIIAHLTGNASQAAIDTCAVLFVLSRILFTICYIANWHLLRSGVWGIGFLTVIALFVLAA